MYTKNVMKKTTISYNETVEGETIENKVRRILENKEPIKDGAPIMYTERKDGVLPSTDVRTDRFLVAEKAMNVVHKAAIAKRQGIISDEVRSKNNEDGGAEPIQATGDKTE